MTPVMQKSGMLICSGVTLGVRATGPLCLGPVRIFRIAA